MNNGALAGASPTASACSAPKAKNTPIATTDAKKPSAGGTAFQWIRRARLAVEAARERTFLIPAATTAAMRDSAAAPYQAAVKPAEITSSSPSGGPNARPRYRPREL